MIISNSFMQSIGKKLPIILPEEMEFADIELNEETIGNDFGALGLDLEELEKMVPPNFRFEAGYTDGGL